MPHAVLVIGAGPSGFYVSEALAKSSESLRVDLIDRLPTPYGLVRSGVAPDHQGTKGVARVFQRTAERPNVRFLGRVELGRDVHLAELEEMYDAVVIATGVLVDRALGVPGEDLPGVLGSTEVTSWYNGHPDYANKAPDIRPGQVVVIGNGNVAVDVSRVLSRRSEEMSKTDLPAYGHDFLTRAQITDVWMMGRRGPLDASFTPVELRELGEMSHTVAVVDPGQLPESVLSDDPSEQKLKEKMLGILQGYAANSRDTKPQGLHIHFYAAPIRIEGTEHVERVVFAKTQVVGGRAVVTDETFVIEAKTVIKAIGYVAAPLTGVGGDLKSTHYPNSDGKIREGLYAVGWAKRGPSGVVATNRADSIAVAEKLLRDLGPAKDSSMNIDELLNSRGVIPSTFEQWLKIDAEEVRRGNGVAPRQKMTDWKELEEWTKLK